MQPLQILEFALSTAVEYRRPVLLADANLDGVVKKLASSRCGDFLNATGVVLTKTNELFSYTLSVPLFNSAASIVVNAQGVTVSFKQGRTKGHLKLMTDLTLAAFEITKVGEIERSVVSFTAHASFGAPSEFAEHMRRYTTLDQSVASGGLVVMTRLPDDRGQLRYSSEKSLAYEDALFFAANATCTGDVTFDLFNTLAGRFEAAAALDGVSVRMLEE